MNIITPTQLRDLVFCKGERFISIYMPTHPIGREGMQDVPRLKNLVVEAEKQLIQGGMRSVAARDFLKSILTLPQQTDWAQRARGLAIFRSDEVLVSYCSASAFDELLIVGRRFHVKKLLPAISERLHFFVLAVSRNHVRLLRATSTGFDRVDTLELPRGIKKTLNLQGADRGEQVHSAMHGDFGKEAAVFHGQGGHRDTIKDEIVEYFRAISDSLRPVVRQSTWPLILAGVDYELEMLRKVFDHNQIVDESLHGSFDHVDDNRLYTLALPIAKEFADGARRRAIAKYRDLTDTIRASDELDEIVPAACGGRVELLLVDPRLDVFGRYNAETNSLDLDMQCEPTLDLVEEVIAQTVVHDGQVVAVGDEVLPAKPLRAVIRYY
jgi:hypothetical protein